MQICLTPLDAGLCSLAMILFNRPITGLLPQMSRDPVNVNNSDAQYEALKAQQEKDTCKDPSIFQQDLQ